MKNLIIKIIRFIFHSHFRNFKFHLHLIHPFLDIKLVFVLLRNELMLNRDSIDIKYDQIKA